MSQTPIMADVSLEELETGTPKEERDGSSSVGAGAAAAAAVPQRRKFVPLGQQQQHKKSSWRRKLLLSGLVSVAIVVAAICGASIATMRSHYQQDSSKNVVTDEQVGARAFAGADRGGSGAPLRHTGPTDLPVYDAAYVTDANLQDAPANFARFAAPNNVVVHDTSGEPQPFRRIGVITQFPREVKGDLAAEEEHGSSKSKLRDNSAGGGDGSTVTLGGGNNNNNTDTAHVEDGASSPVPLPTPDLPAAPVIGDERTEPAPLFAAASLKRDGCYNVKLRRGSGLQGVRRIRRALNEGHWGIHHHDWSATVEGFSMCNVSASHLDTIRGHPMVDFVEEDTHVAAIVNWNLDRLDQLDLPLDGAYNTGSVNGAGVDAYIVDTGIRTTHVQFGGRVAGGKSFVTGDSSIEDCYGHGSHVAGLVGGVTFGVAPGVSLFAVRVLDCSGSGTSSGVIAGLDWIVSNMRSGRRSVVNLSLAGPASAVLDSAVSSLVAAGAVVGVAAGNDGADACYYSPARVAEAISVGAVDSSDNFASFSNTGSCVDILAPGVAVTSAYYGTDTQAATMSGTSMASPHVVGAAALYLQSNPSATPSQVRSAIINAATSNTINGVAGSTPNKMLFVNNLVSKLNVPPPSTTKPTTTQKPTTRPTPTTAAASPSTSPSTCKGNLCQTSSVVSGRVAFLPTPSGYYCTSSTGSITHHAILSPTTTAASDLDLYLLRWNPTTQLWYVKALSATAGSHEEVWFTSADGPGCWSWEVYSYYGSVPFKLDMQVPQ
jgi:subtilisin family serine protease